MSRSIETLPADYFEKKYKDDNDPWQFRTSAYERGKYDLTLAALSKSAYPLALEVGCSIGVLTGLLAARCQALVAIDGSPTAIASARVSAPDNVLFRVGMLPQDFPERRFDLIVLSEVLYYFSETDLNVLAQQCCTALMPGGEMVLCHWLGLTDYPLSGAAASALFGKAIVTRVPARTVLHDGEFLLERYAEW